MSTKTKPIQSMVDADILTTPPEGRIPIDYTSKAKPPEVWQEDIPFAEVKS